MTIRRALGSLLLLALLVALVNSTVAVVLILLSAVGWLVWHDLRTRVAGDL